MKKLIKALSVLLLGLSLAFLPSTQANAKDAFTFQYILGTNAVNYNVYALAAPIGSLASQPAGTHVLAFWWVWDLGPAPAMTSGTNVVCPEALVPQGLAGGELFFANVGDVDTGGSQVNTLHPIGDVRVTTFKSGNFTNSLTLISVIDPISHGPYTEKIWFNGLSFTPFGWSFDPNLY